jgi:hypothetical protein
MEVVVEMVIMTVSIVLNIRLGSRRFNARLSSRTFNIRFSKKTCVRR